MCPGSQHKKQGQVGTLCFWHHSPLAKWPYHVASSIGPDFEFGINMLNYIHHKTNIVCPVLFGTLEACDSLIVLIQGSMLLILLSHSRRNRLEKSAKGIGFQSCIHSFIQCILIELNILRLHRALCILMQPESQISPLKSTKWGQCPHHFWT